MGCITSRRDPQAKAAKWVWEIVTVNGAKTKKLVKKHDRDERH